MKKEKISLKVNGEVHELEVYPHKTLLEILRAELGLTGAKEGCGEGACGACTILQDGKPIRSCLTLAIEAQGKVELASNRKTGGEYYLLILGNKPSDYMVLSH